MNEEPWHDLVSDRVGVVRALHPQVRGSDEPEPPYLWTAELANFDFRNAPKADRIMARKGRTEAAAKAAAVGEAVERYCAAHWGEPDRMFTATAAQVDDRVITPAECVLYSTEQYARSGFPFQP